MADKINIALAGNPNCGKTTLFNELTGSNGYVGNWPGVTVEKKQAPWKSNRDVMFVDLPGIYSLSPYSPEEVVSRDYVVNDRPDAVIDLVDVTNLERNLYLTTQVLEAGRPVVVGLNMCDLLKERGDVVDTAKLSGMLGAPVVEVSALKSVDERLGGSDVRCNGNVVYVAETEQIDVVRFVRLRVERVAEEYQTVDLVAGDAGSKLLVAALRAAEVTLDVKPGGFRN